MSLRDRLPDTSQRDAPLGWRLKSWVARRPLPQDGRQRLMEAAGKPPKAWRSIWKRFYLRRVRPLLPNRAAVPFSAEDLFSSVTMLSSLHFGCIMCT
jgi:hypothetical protein